jgi:hypothetical protein
MLEKNEIITLSGKIGFEPENKTKKHNLQASWKRIAMVFFDGDVCEYYSWYIKKRYGLVLNKPIREAHISFINDKSSDMSLNGEISLQEVDDNWKRVKEKWDGQEVQISLCLNARTDGSHWWLNVEDESKKSLQLIRNELNLGPPFYGFHMSIGYANERNIEHSKYIHRLLINNLTT